MSKFNGVNNNYFPPQSRFSPIDDYPEMDSFKVEKTEAADVVRRVQRTSSVDLGEVSMYSLQSLLKNGVDPKSLNIRTSNVSRLDSVNQLDAFASTVDSLFDDSSTNSDDNSNNSK